MHITDPIADLLTRIRNASHAHHTSVDCPASNMKKAIAQILLDEGYLCNLAVSEAFRRRGIGKALMTAAIECCKAQGCAFLSLEVRPSNTAAVRLYEALGFTKRGERKQFYTLPDEDALILTLDF